jgi:hypothetical protein
MKLRSLLFLLLLPVSLFAQSAGSCHCNALIDIKYDGYVELLKTPGGAVLNKLKHNKEQEDYLTLTIDKEAGNYFHATAIYAMSNKKYYGWVKKSSVIGTYDRNYSNTDLLLFKSPLKNAAVSSRIPPHSNLFFSIVHCNRSNWVYVSNTSKEKTVTGWLAPDMQCANHYTTCN